MSHARERSAMAWYRIAGTPRPLTFRVRASYLPVTTGKRTCRRLWLRDAIVLPLTMWSDRRDPRPILFRTLTAAWTALMDRVTIAYSLIALMAAAVAALVWWNVHHSHARTYARQRTRQTAREKARQAERDDTRAS